MNFLRPYWFLLPPTLICLFSPTVQNCRGRLAMFIDALYLTISAFAVQQPALNKRNSPKEQLP